MCVVSMIGDHYSDKWRQQEYADMLKRLQDTPVNPSPFFAHPTVNCETAIVKAKPCPVFCGSSNALNS